MIIAGFALPTFFRDGHNIATIEENKTSSTKTIATSDKGKHVIMQSACLHELTWKIYGRETVQNEEKYSQQKCS
jgi:hypothetical protein